MRRARSYSETCVGSRPSGFVNAPVRALNLAVYENADGADDVPAASDGSRYANAGSMPCAAAAACIAYSELVAGVDASGSSEDDDGAAEDEEASDCRGFVQVVSCVLAL